MADTATTFRADPSTERPDYLGWAAPGTSESAALWAIAKVTWSGAGIISVKWAGGSDDYTNVWADRAGLAYT